MTEQTVKCKICGKLYVFYAYYAGDQSVCPRCRSEAREQYNKWENKGWYPQK